MSSQRASKQAEAILGLHWDRALPVNVTRIAKKLGLKVVKAPLGEGVSGLLVRTADGVQVCIAEDDQSVRQRFTLAHEIGHHVMDHQFEPGAHVHVDRGNYISQRGMRASQGIDPKEIEANQFAACLLMPAQILKEEARTLLTPQLSDIAVSLLARRFQVSEQAMTIRLSVLGLL